VGGAREDDETGEAGVSWNIGYEALGAGGRAHEADGRGRGGRAEAGPHG